MTIAVVIPALNEAAGISEAIESAISPNVQVVVVDGGSADDTRRRAREAGARVLDSAPGRGRQLQAGVEATTGDPVVLLHADTRLPTGWVEAVLGSLESPGTVAGAFRLHFDRGGGLGAWLRLIELSVRLRVRLCGLPYGDQAIFVRRRVLAEIGGVPDVPVLEDLDLVKALKKRGNVAALELPVSTSARRYRELGAGRTVALHAVALSGWLLGVDRHRVAGWLSR